MSVDKIYCWLPAPLQALSQRLYTHPFTNPIHKTVLYMRKKGFEHLDSLLNSAWPVSGRDGIQTQADWLQHLSSQPYSTVAGVLQAKTLSKLKTHLRDPGS